MVHTMGRMELAKMIKLKQCLVCVYPRIRTLSVALSSTEHERDRRATDFCNYCEIEDAKQL